MPKKTLFSLDAFKKAKRKNGTVAFISGNFNVIHAGHMRLFKFASDVADYLIVGLNSDGSPDVSVPLQLRTEALQGISYITQVFTLDQPVQDFISYLQPDIVVKGKEFENTFNIEEEILASYGGKLLFSSGEMRFSSLDLLKKDMQSEYISVSLNADFPLKHNFSLDCLGDILDSFSSLRVLVIGDLIIDDYISCDPLGMSQEDPTIVVTPLNKQTFVGGAGIVAAHARGLGAEVTFISVTGDDSLSRFSLKKFKEFGVDAHIALDSTRPTTLKSRYRANGKTLLRVNELRQHAISVEIQERILSWVKSKISGIDLILFADFNYGCLPQTLVNSIIELAKSKNVMMCADSQASSQISDISRFKGMSLITPTEREARLALQDFESGLAITASHLSKRAEADNVILTLGSEGLLILSNTGKVEALDRIEALNRTPKDVAGAGDSLFTCTSMALCKGNNIWTSAYLGSLAAGVQVSRVGNVPLSCNDILNVIRANQKR